MHCRAAECGGGVEPATGQIERVAGESTVSIAATELGPLGDGDRMPRPGLVREREFVHGS